MANILDSKNEKYKGESKVYDCIEKNLPNDNMVCYYNREINGRQFDFCLIIEEIGMLIIEVKGWNPSNIVKVVNPDYIEINLYEKPVGSPKKQARSYRFDLINTFDKKYSINPLVMDMVCYPFMSEQDYKKCGLQIVSEPEFTLFKEDIENKEKFIKKINGVYKKMNTFKYDNMKGSIYQTCRSYFETEYTLKTETKESKPYSELRIYHEKVSKFDIDSIVNSYFLGTKQYIFVADGDSLKSVVENIIKNLNNKGILLKGRNFVISSLEQNKITVQNEFKSFFNFEIFLIENMDENINSNIIISNGNFKDDQKKIVENLSRQSGFNFDQYLLEHAPVNENIVVKAGAGTGKTYSMISRIAFICHASSCSSVTNLSNEVAMLTFTRKAASNMKTRLKQMFLNYFVLTKDKKYLEMICEIENMRISTIHSFANQVIKDTSLPLGIGVDFITIGGNYKKQKLFDTNFNKYLEDHKNNQVYFDDFPGGIYGFRKLLLSFADKLYNKGYDIKEATSNSFGEPIKELPYVNEIIEDVIIKTEKDYSKYLYENNSVNQTEYMIYLNKCINDDSFNKNLYQYKYVFIDEFQDVDDSQISAFLEMQEKLDFKFFIVGDLKQSIYRFRGATMDAFNKMGCTEENKWREYTLNINYRTDKRLLDMLSKVFKDMGNNKFIPYKEPKDVLIGINENNLSEESLIESYIYNPDEEKEGYIYNKTLEIVNKRKKEIESNTNFHSLSNSEKTIAILVRTNREVSKFLKNAKTDNEFIIESDTNGDLYKLQSTIDLCKLVAALTNSRNTVYLLDLLLSNNVKIKFSIEKIYKLNEKDKLEYLIELLNKFYGYTMGMTWSELVYDAQTKPVLMVLRNIYENTKPWIKYSSDKGNQNFYRANYDLIFEDLSSESRYSYLTLDYISEALSMLIQTNSKKSTRFIDNDSNQVHVVCTTVHKSKGLEYDTVIMPFTDFPINVIHNNNLDVACIDDKVGYCITTNKKTMYNEYFSLNEEEIEIQREESRLLYVSMTRAINKFCCLNKKKSENITWGKILKLLMED